MSDNWIIIIPESPDYIPDETAQARTVALFHEIAPNADEIKKELSEQIRFIDCGSNLSSVICPHCERELDFEWWQTWMDEEAEAGFPIRIASLPCCGAEGSLQTLRYDWPQGFARFSVEAMNPGIPDVSPERMIDFEGALGCPVRKILQHI